MRFYHNSGLSKMIKLFVLLLFPLLTVSSSLNSNTLITVNKNQNLEKMVEVPKDYVSKIIPVCSNSSTKTYMSYKSITSKTSSQYKYINNYMEVSNEGLLVDADGYIGVALGSYFGRIGTRYIFKLDTGIELKLVKVDQKSDNHTINGCQHKTDTSVIEFVIDTVKAKEYYGLLSNKYILNGNFNNSPKFKGKIVEIKQISNK